MEYDRREGGSSESMAAKEAAKTNASWYEDSKAVIKDDTAEAGIKEEKVKAAIAKRQNWRCVYAKDFICLILKFPKCILSETFSYKSPKYTNITSAIYR